MKLVILCLISSVLLAQNAAVNGIPNQNVVLNPTPLSPAVAGAGSVSVSGTTVSGSGSNFRTLFPKCLNTCSNGEAIAIYPSTIPQSGKYFTATPMPGTSAFNNGEDSSLLWGVGSSPNISMAVGDQFIPARQMSPNAGAVNTNVPDSGNVGYKEFWSVNKISTYNSNMVYSAITVYPRVGSAFPYPIIHVSSGSVRIIFNNPHSLNNGAAISVTGSPGAAWDGTYTVADNLMGMPYKETSYMVRTDNPRSLADGVYASEGLSMNSGGALGASPTVTISVSAGTATATFSFPHGFTTGDTINVSGYTGGQSGINGTYSATVVGTDWPNQLTFPSGATGTYNQQTGVIASGYSINPHPIWLMVASVSSDTALTLTSTGGTLSTTIKYYAAPDNYAALNGTNGLFTTNKDFTVQSGDFYINNSPSVTGQSDGSLFIGNYNHAATMTPGARFILIHPEYAGFRFQGGVDTTLDRWTINHLYQAPTGLGGFPATLAIYFSTRPKVYGISSSISSGNFLDFEDDIAPTVRGMNVHNVSNGGCLVTAASTMPLMSDIQCINTADYISIFSIINGLNNRTMRGAVISNVTAINNKRALYILGPDVVATNFYIEGTQETSLEIEDGSDVDSKNSHVSHMQINQGGALGPGLQYCCYPANIGIQGTGAYVFLEDITVNNSWGMGLFATGGGATYINSLKLANTAGPGMHVNYTGVGLLNMSNVSIVGSYGPGAIIFGVYKLLISNLSLDSNNLLHSYTSHTGDSLLVSNSTYNTIDNVSLFDGFGTGRGYGLFEGTITGASKWTNARGFTADATHQFRTAGGTAGLSYFKNSAFTQTLAAASTISPTTETFNLNTGSAISTITKPPMVGEGDQFCALPQGAGITTTLGGNIALASTLTANRMICWKWSLGFWWPSY